MANIELRNVSFSYEEETVLHDLSLTFEEGQFICVLGHNGSGKSTLAKLLNGILVPQSGKVLVDGLDTAREEDLLPIRKTVGMVFQNPDNQMVANVVEEDVAFAPENLGCSTEEIRRRVDEALESVGMTEYAAHSPGLLSGGQKQRVAIAGILAMEPRFIVLDEPTAMLDPRGRREVMDTLLKLNREKGITIILITHHMEEAAQAQRLVVMDKGAVVMDGAPEVLFRRVEELKALGLDVPETVELTHRLKALGIPLEESGLSAEDCAQALCRLLK